jgi:hypothetical protein
MVKLSIIDNDNDNFRYVYIIIWLSPYVLSVHSLSPPEPAGLDSPNCRPWKDHFKSDLRSDQDHLLKKDLRSDQDHI